MPIVRSYFRRAPGVAAASTSAARRLDVAIYDAGGEDLLRDRTGGRYQVEELTFESGLPGGFLSAAFRLALPTARSWPGRAGLKTIIRRGNRVLWWGWVEDVRQAVRGRVEGLQVTCLGPWQVVGQRRATFAHTGTVYGDMALGTALGEHCSEVTTDYSQLTPTGVNIAPLTWTQRTVAELVKLVCETGNSSGQQMLFALWEAAGRNGNGYPEPINRNPSFEEMAGSSLVGWTSTVVTGSPTSSLLSGTYLSPVRSVKWIRGPEAGTQSGRLQTDSGYYIPVSAETDYVVDYWAYFGAIGSISCYARMNWYNSGGGLISQVALTVRTSTGSAFGARYVETTTSPAGAVECRLDLVFSLPDSGAQSYIVFDDAYMYALGAPLAVDPRPRAHLWPRDLSAGDYRLYTSDLADALGVDVTTRDLANSVVGKYGSSYTAAAQDVDSQGLYRRRDAVVDAGSASSSTVAAAMRDAYLARYLAPLAEPGSFKLAGPGAVRNLRGRPIWPEELRAGDRLELADGPQAGTVILLTRVAYADGVVSCTPERAADVPMLLARV